MVLAQTKVEHAVLWSLVREDYSSEFAGVRTIRSHLLNIASEQQVGAAISHLLECKLIRDCSAPLQDNYEPTRDGILLIERLETVKSSFVGRLNIHGPKWLSSQSAINAELQSKLSPPPMPTSPPSGPNEPTGVSPVTIYNQANPSFSNSNSQTPTGSDDTARSAKNAGWVAVWVALAVGAAAIVITLWVGGKI